MSEIGVRNFRFQVRVALETEIRSKYTKVGKRKLKKCIYIYIYIYKRKKDSIELQIFLATLLFRTKYMQTNGYLKDNLSAVG